MARPNRQVRHLAVLIVATVLGAQPDAAVVVAQQPKPPGYRAGYAQLRTYVTESADPARLKIALQAKFGERGVNQMFRLDSKLFDNPHLPGLKTSVLAAITNNPYANRGHARTLMYAEAMLRDGRFEVLDLNRWVRRGGRTLTDIDLVIRNRATDRIYWIEVKDLSLESQRRNLARLSRQMARQSQEAAREGAQLLFINRRGLIPELRQLAQRQGVFAFEKVMTGPKNLAKAAARGMPANSLLSVLDDLQRSQEGASFWFWLTGWGAPAPRSGHSLAAGSVPAAGRWVAQGSGRARTGTSTWWGASVSKRLPRDLGAGPLLRVGSRAVIVAEALIQAQALYKYSTGAISQREFARYEAAAVGGGVGAWAGLTAGAWGGAAIGSVVPVVGTAAGGVVGGFLGLIGGGYAGSELATQAVNSWCDQFDAALRRELIDAIARDYGVVR